MPPVISKRRTLARLTSDTKSGRRATAEFATRTWRSHSHLEGSARCTVCGLWVHTVRRHVEYELESWSNALVGAMVEHLEDECPLATRSRSSAVDDGPAGNDESLSLCVDQAVWTPIAAEDRSNDAQRT
jgi:hypothetical protein